MSGTVRALVLGIAVCGACTPNTLGSGHEGTAATETTSSSSTGTTLAAETHATGAVDPDGSGTTVAGTTEDGTTLAVPTTDASSGPGLETADTDEPTQEIEYCTVAELPIPDDVPDGVSSSITVDLPGGGIIVSLQLVIQATHPHVGDLRFDLRRAKVNAIIVIDQPGNGGCSGSDIDVVLHDGGDASVQDGCGEGTPALSGEHRPVTLLNPMYGGQQMLGTWRLRAIDRAEDDAGTLDAWCLRITYR